ncbi:hypothetical protein HA402_005452 [Bradysia odoriphaga]|nr:hypothetical protein HA402_005452 [Bradysia odoriphaga]
MPKISVDAFKELMKLDGFDYVLKTKDFEPIRKDLPNIPQHHKDYFDERCGRMPRTNIFGFEYKGLKYKLFRNMGDGDCNDGNFGAVFAENEEKIVDLISSGDMETTIESLKSDDTRLSEEFCGKLAPYLVCFETVLSKYTEFEFLIFKILLENDCLYDLSVIDDRCEEYNDDDDEEDDDEEEEEDDDDVDN